MKIGDFGQWGLEKFLWIGSIEDDVGNGLEDHLVWN